MGGTLRSGRLSLPELGLWTGAREGGDWFRHGAADCGIRAMDVLRLLMFWDWAFSGYECFLFSFHLACLVSLISFCVGRWDGPDSLENRIAYANSLASLAASFLLLVCCFLGKGNTTTFSIRLRFLTPRRRRLAEHVYPKGGGSGALALCEDCRDRRGRDPRDDMGGVGMRTCGHDCARDMGEYTADV